MTHTIRTFVSGFDTVLVACLLFVSFWPTSGLQNNSKKQMILTMDTIRSLFLPPQDYSSIRPHHIVVWYTIERILSKTTIVKSLKTAFLKVLSQALLPLIYWGIVPDVVIRFGIRLQLHNHLAQLHSSSAVIELEQKLQIVDELRTMPIAIATQEANEQHYEVPAKFYTLCLGPCKKYSSGYWPTRQTTFEESEIYMLDLYCQRAKVQDGMHIVDLGTLPMEDS
jgi:Mycolic acid cyclopropane synthetase